MKAHIFTIICFVCRLLAVAACAALLVFSNCWNAMLVFCLYERLFMYASSIGAGKINRQSNRFAFKYCCNDKTFKCVQFELRPKLRNTSQ